MPTGVHERKGGTYLPYVVNRLTGKFYKAEDGARIFKTEAEAVACRDALRAKADAAYEAHVRRIWDTQTAKDPKHDGQHYDVIPYLPKDAVLGKLYLRLDPDDALFGFQFDDDLHGRRRARFELGRSKDRGPELRHLP